MFQKKHFVVLAQKRRKEKLELSISAEEGVVVAKFTRWVDFVVVYEDYLDKVIGKYKQAKENNVIVVKPSFVFDSLKKGKLQDYKLYEIEASTNLVDTKDAIDIESPDKKRKRDEEEGEGEEKPIKKQKEGSKPVDQKAEEQNYGHEKEKNHIGRADLKGRNPTTTEKKSAPPPKAINSTSLKETVQQHEDEDVPEQRNEKREQKPSTQPIPSKAANKTRKEDDNEKNSGTTSLPSREKERNIADDTIITPKPRKEPTKDQPIVISPTKEVDDDDDDDDVMVISPPKGKNANVVKKEITKTVTSLDKEVETTKPSTSSNKEKKTNDPPQDMLHKLIWDLQHDQGTPTKVVGRENEYNMVLDFWKNCLLMGKSGSLYLCGKPGTGKTLTISTVIENMAAREKKRARPIYLNCTQQKDPRQIYKRILDCMVPKNAASLAQAEMELDELLLKNDGSGEESTSKIVVVLDEIDQLSSKDCSVLQKLFEWPSKKNSKIILIGVANELDLVERKLSILTRSGKAPTVISFHPYTYPQLSLIIKSRIEKFQVFDPVAIELCARKVASIDGDVRKALDVCISAAESKLLKITAAEKGGQEIDLKIGLPDMSAALTMAYPSATISVVKNLPLHHQLVLCAAVVLNQKGFSRDTVHTSYQSVCSKTKMKTVSRSQVDDILEALLSQNLLDSKGKGKQEKFNILVTKDDINDGLDESLNSLRDMLSN